MSQRCHICGIEEGRPRTVPVTYAHPETNEITTIGSTTEYDHPLYPCRKCGRLTCSNCFNSYEDQTCKTCWRSAAHTWKCEVCGAEADYVKHYHCEKCGEAVREVHTCSRCARQVCERCRYTGPSSFDGTVICVQCWN